MKVYIAGPMTGLPDFNRDPFRKQHVSLMNEGHIVLCPAILPNGLSQHEYMDICFAMVRAADAIFMLRGWEKSDGAVAEHALAKKLGLSIILEHAA